MKNREKLTGISVAAAPIYLSIPRSSMLRLVKILTHLCIGRSTTSAYTRTHIHIYDRATKSGRSVFSFMSYQRAVNSSKLPRRRNKRRSRRDIARHDMLLSFFPPPANPTAPKRLRASVSVFDAGRAKS